MGVIYCDKQLQQEQLRWSQFGISSREMLRTNLSMHFRSISLSGFDPLFPKYVMSQETR